MQIASASTREEQIELYKACYDFVDDPTFDSYALERICKVDPRTNEEIERD